MFIVSKLNKRDCSLSLHDSFSSKLLCFEVKLGISYSFVYEEKKGLKKSVSQKQLTYATPPQYSSSTASLKEASSSNASAQYINTESSDAAHIAKQAKTSKKPASTLKHTLASRQAYQQPNR